MHAVECTPCSLLVFAFVRCRGQLASLASEFQVTHSSKHAKIYIWYLAGEIQKQAPQDTLNDSKQASSTASLKHNEQPYKHSKRDNKIHDNHTVYPWPRNGD